MASNEVIAAFMIVNFLLTFVTALYLYKTREFRKKMETRSAIAALLLYSVRYFWMFFKYTIDFYDELVMRLVTLDLVVLVGMVLIWTNIVVNLNEINSEKVILIFKRFYQITLVIISITFILALILPPDAQKHDMNIVVAILFFPIEAAIVLQMLFRVIIIFYYRDVTSERRLHYGLLVTGLAMVSVLEAILFWFQQSLLQVVIPSFGFIFIILASYFLNSISYNDIFKAINAGMIIVTDKGKLMQFNYEAEKYIIPEYFTSGNTLDLHKAFPSLNSIIDKFSLLKISKAIQLEDIIYNYKEKNYENVHLTFYPLGEFDSNKTPPRIGIAISNSDEMAYLRERRDFLFDLLTHDIANVNHTLKLTLEVLSKKKGEEAPFIELAKKQSDKLENLVYSAQNLLLVDKLDFPHDEVVDFNSRFQLLIDEKLTQFPDFKINVSNLDQLKPIKTTGNLKAAFNLIFDAIILTSDEINNSLEIKTAIKNGMQKIDFVFPGQNIKADLLSSYSNEKKSELVAASSSRINIIVASTIISKNGGILDISNLEDKKFTTISINLPILT